MAYLLSETDAARISRVVSAFERGFGRNAKTPVQPQAASAQSVLAILLEDLPGDSEAQACICRYEPNNSVQSVTLIGGFVEQIKLGFRQKTTDQTVYTAPIQIQTAGTAKAIKDALTALDAIGQDDVDVQFGTFGYNGRTYETGRWFVEWTGQYAGRQLPLLLGQVKYQGQDGFQGPTITHPIQVAYTRTVPQWELITVYSALPLPEPTPLRAGAKVVCTQIAGIGYVVTAAEARDYFRS